MMKAKWMERFWKDFTQKEFIPIKILFFLIFGGMNTLFPFLSIQARSLGITVDELGIIYSLLPVIGCFAPAVAGMFADTIGNFKVFLAITVSLSGFASLLFLTIPVGRITHTLPEDLPLTLNFTRFNTSLRINEPLICDFKDISSIDLKGQYCKYTCLDRTEAIIEIKELNESWCTVSGNCEALDKEISETRNGTSHNNKTNSFSFKADLSERELITELAITHNIFHDIHQKMSKKEAANSNGVASHLSNDSLECWLQCDVSTHTKTLCNNSQTVEVISPGTTMMAYIAIRLLNSFTLTCSIPLFEGAATAILKEHNGDFGYQRLYANLGMVVMTPISGKLIDVISAITGKDDFRPAFYMYCALKLLSAVVIVFMSLDFKKPSNTVVKDVKVLIVQPRVSCFLIFTMVSGSCYGFIDTFLFWFLEDMNADKSLMGLAVTFGALFGIPLLLLSTYIIKRISHVGTLCMCMGVLTIRLIGYSFIQNPWMAMPFEAMESFTNSLMGVVSVSYTAVLSIPSTVTSLQGIYNGTYHGIGRGIGSLIGGFLINNIGIRATFQLLACASTTAALVYFAVNWFIFKKSNENRTTDDVIMEKGKEFEASWERNIIVNETGIDEKTITKNNDETAANNEKNSKNSFFSTINNKNKKDKTKPKY